MHCFRVTEAWTVLSQLIIEGKRRKRGKRHRSPQNLIYRSKPWWLPLHPHMLRQCTDPRFVPSLHLSKIVTSIKKTDQHCPWFHLNNVFAMTNITDKYFDRISFDTTTFSIKFLDRSLGSIFCWYQQAQLKYIKIGACTYTKHTVLYSVRENTNTPKWKESF